MGENIELSKSVRIINVLNKVMFVLSIVFLVIACIGIISGITGTIWLLVNKDIDVEGVPLWLKIISETARHEREGINIYTLALYVLNGAIYSLGIGCICFFGLRYFKLNIKNKTVFTKEGGKGLFKLGLTHIIIGLAVIILTSIVYAIFSNVFKDDIRLGGLEIRYVGFGWAGLGLGIIFLVISLFINAYVENTTKN